MNDIIWEVGQLGHMNSEAFVHNAWLDLIQQRERVIIGQCYHVTVFNSRDRVGQISYFMKMCRKHSEAFRFFRQVPAKHDANRRKNKST